MIRLLAGLLLIASAAAGPVAATAFRLGMRGDTAVSIPPEDGAAPSVVTIDATPYARTVSCGTYTLTGTFTGSAPTSWSASPSGATGACSDTGGGTFSCSVDVDPDATGEGVETITVGGDTVTIGFYVEGEHTCFLAQSVDGTYNATLSDLDPVATWENLGSSALDVTQGTGAAQPTFRTSIVGGQPMVRCDGGDRLAAAAVANWTFLHNGSDWTVDNVIATSQTDPNSLQIEVGTSDVSTGAVIGVLLGRDDRSSISRNDKLAAYMSNGSLLILNSASPASEATQQRFHGTQWVLDEGGSPEWSINLNGTQLATASVTGYTASNPAFPLNICQVGSLWALTGDLFRVLIYQSALTATQRGINEAVDEWALGGSLPVSPPIYHLDSSDSATITTAGGSVSSWRSTGLRTASVDQGTGGSQPVSTVSGSSSQVDFDGTDDFLSVSTQIPTANSHMFVVATVDSVATNGTGASCGNNDGAATYATSGGIKFRTSAGTAYVIAQNNDGTVDCAETTITLGVKTIYERRVDGSNVSVAVDGGAFTSTASGTSNVTSQSLIIASRDASNDRMDGKIHEVLVYGDDLDSTTRNAVIAELQAKWGL